MCCKGEIFIVYLCIVFCCFTNCLCQEKSGAKSRRSPNDTTNPILLCALDACTCTNFSPNSSQWTTINCNFYTEEEVNIIPGSLPKKAREIILTGPGKGRGGKISLREQSFSNLDNPAIVILRGFNVVVIKKSSFLNSTANHPVVHVTESGIVTIETGAFRNTLGPPSVNITDCNHLTIQGEAFSRLNTISIRDVRKLDLLESAFVFESRSRGRHGPFTKIILKNIVADNFPKKTFGSSVNEISLQHVNVRDVQGEAFCATSYNTVIAINSSFYKFYKEAFTQRTHINDKFELFNCTIASIASEAIQSGASNLTIKYSKLKELASGAISMSVANVVIEDNELGVIHERGLSFSKWSHISIERNVIDQLETEPILCALDEIVKHDSSYLFTFINNGILNLTKGSLMFITDVRNVLPSLIYEHTYFNQDCICGIENWLALALMSDQFLQYVMDNSYCSVKDTTLAKCYNVFQESMLIRNFTTEACSNETSLRCLPGITKSTGTEIQNTKFLNRKIQLRETEEMKMLNKKIVAALAIVVSVGVVAIVAFLIIRKCGYCVPIANASVSSNNCCVRVFDRICNAHYGMDTARSISRLSIQEYNESHRLHETRILNDDDVRYMGVVGEDNLDVDIPMMEKATQTLPEELTKELLESLREKLDDPDNYNEAREMIEHLYDLIKVEESCNSNNNVPVRDDYQENLYDVIQVPVKRKGKNDKVMVSVGTRVPSLERLTQFNPYVRPTALCHEYFEPRDQTPHLYAELPTDRNADMPDLVGERTSRPLSFLRAIGEKINPHHTPSGPVGSVRSIDSAKRMANRPLPDKPKDPGEGTSFQKQ